MPRTFAWLAGLAGLFVVAPLFAQAPAPKVLVWKDSAASVTRYYGVLGEVAQPAAYSSEADITLQTLIEAAGGLTSNASPSIRILRGERGGHRVFYSPDGRDPLQPGDFVVVDALRPRPDSPGVWLGLLGVAPRPVVVWMNAQQATAATIIEQALQQSPLLARATQLHLPPAAAANFNPQGPLPSGTVLALPATLLVTARLPEFPQARPISTDHPRPTPPVLSPGPQAPTHVPAPTFAASAPQSPQPTIAVPPGVAAPQTGGLSFDREITATPVPFATAPASDPPANPASLPAPGSRFAIPVPAPLPQTPKLPASSVATNLTAAETDPAAETPAELGGVTSSPPELSAAESSAAEPFSIWQIVGISSVVLSLVGIALGTRTFLERFAPAAIGPTELAAAGRIPAPSGRMMSAVREMSPAPRKMPRREPAGPTPLEELRALLNERLPIVTEEIEFPTAIPLQRPRPATPAFRVDAAHASGGSQPHADWTAATSREPRLELDAATESPVPKPHGRNPAAAPAAATVPAPVIAAADRPATSERSDSFAMSGSPIERALSRLQRGRHE